MGMGCCGGSCSLRFIGNRWGFLALLVFLPEPKPCPDQSRSAPAPRITLGRRSRKRPNSREILPPQVDERLDDAT